MTLIFYDMILQNKKEMQLYVCQENIFSLQNVAFCFVLITLDSYVFIIEVKYLFGNASWYPNTRAQFQFTWSNHF